MISPVTRLSHVALRSPDVQRLRSYYTEVVGLTPYDEGDGVVFLASGGYGPALELRPSTTAGLDHVGFEVSDAHEDELLARLRNQSVDVSTSDDSEPGLSRVHEVHDVEGNLLQLCVVDEAAPRPPVAHRRDRAQQARSHRVPDAQRRGGHRVLRVGARLPLVRLDGRLLRLPALQHRSPHGQLRQRVPAQASCTTSPSSSATARSC